MFDRISVPSAQRVPPFTHEVQTWIWERQNPPARQCAEQQFLLGFAGTDEVLRPCLHLRRARVSGGACDFFNSGGQGCIPCLCLRNPNLQLCAAHVSDLMLAA